MATISLNGTSFTPSDVARESVKIGKDLEAADGSRRWIHRADKREYTLTWRKVTATVRNQVRTIFALTTTFTFVDQDGTSVTVFCKAGAYQDNISLIAMGPTLYYDVTLKITEA